MIQHKVTIHLNRPVEHVFAFLADARNLPTWQSNLIESAPLTDGPLGHLSQVKDLAGWSRSL